MKAINRIEPFLFYLLVAVNICPAIFNHIVLSLDGPAHAYNAAMLKAFMTGHGEALSHYLDVNSLAVPNWSSHLVMVFFQFFVSPALSEKLLVISFLVFTPISFRYLIKSFPGVQIVGSYFIFILTYNTFQVFGFYNFLIAFIPAFYLLGYLVRNMGHMGRKQYIVVSLLMVAVFISHVFIFLLCILTIALIVCFHLLSLPGIKFKTFFVLLWNMGWPLAVAAIPSLILAYCFSTTKPELIPFYLPKQEVWEMFKKNQSLIGFQHSEMEWTKPLLKLFLALTLIAFSYRAVSFWQRRKLMVQDVFPLLLAVFFVLLFTLPDGDGWGGYYTLRTLMLLNVFMLLWAAVTHSNKWFKLGALLVMLYFHAYRMKHYHREVRSQQSVLVACDKASYYTKPGKLLIPINVSGNWLHSHTGMRAASRGCISVDNYEASVNYFPLIWKRKIEEMPVLPNGKIPTDFVMWQWEPASKTRVVEYIFIIGDIAAQQGPSYDFLKKALAEHYKEIFGEENCHLYELKTMTR